MVGPLGRRVNRNKDQIILGRRSDYQGGALRWENAGPLAHRLFFRLDLVGRTSRLRISNVPRRGVGAHILWPARMVCLSAGGSFGLHLIGPPYREAQASKAVPRGTNAKIRAPLCESRRDVRSPSEGQRPGCQTRPLPTLFHPSALRPTGPTVCSLSRRARRCLPPLAVIL